MQRKFFSLLLLCVLYASLPALSQHMASLAYSPEAAIKPEESNFSTPSSQSHSMEYLFHQLNSRTPLDIEFNSHVERYVDLFLNKRRADLELSLERAQLYFPIFEEMLDKYNLPLELKYLAVIESGLNPLAKSPSGAVGLWQFLYTTCSLFDLRVDSYIDERCDPYKSTEAACKYLSYLYRTYNDWNLAMASYNGGPGEVRKAIERSGGKTDYWELRPYLSDQARNYVPAFIAMNYLMTHYELHNIKTPNALHTRENTDTVMINYGVSFHQISAVLNISSGELSKLNPAYRRQYIPNLDHPCTLVLPANLIPEYLKAEKKIVSYITPQDDYHMLKANAGSIENKSKIVHVVRKGEFCHKIALSYNCTIENIKAWNNLTSTTIYPGQTLNIWVSNSAE